MKYIISCFYGFMVADIDLMLLWYLCLCMLAFFSYGFFALYFWYFDYDISWRDSSLVMTVWGLEDFLYLDICFSRFWQYLANTPLTRMSKTFDFLPSPSSTLCRLRLFSRVCRHTFEVQWGTVSRSNLPVWLDSLAS